MRVMIQDLMDWLTVNPWMILMIPLMILGSVAFSIWRDHRRQKKLEANPITMTNTEYRTFNKKRFSK